MSSIATMKKAEIIIIGAGAAGLMAARELAKGGKKVLILEARDRIGGRIYPLKEADFGYPAQGGAEFVHGDAPVTKSLMKEASLTFIPEEGEIWTARTSGLSVRKKFIQKTDLLHERLSALKSDISILDFLKQNFPDEKDEEFRDSIIKMVEGHDAADPRLVSTLTLRGEWLGKVEQDQGRIKEGYGAVVNFLKQECKKYGVEISLNTLVEKINCQKPLISIQTKEKITYGAQKVIVTVPLPVLKDIDFDPEIKEKLLLASKIGFGNVIKIILKFKTRFWENSKEKDLSKMLFTICNEKFPVWWTQYPEINSVLVGWMAGPEVLKHKNSSEAELLEVAFVSLSNVFKISKEKFTEEILAFKVVNWTADPLTQGAYSYTTIHTKDAYEQLAKPIDNKLFFAGEAVYYGDSVPSTGKYAGDSYTNATVEGALESGQKVAEKILKQ